MVTQFEEARMQEESLCNNTRYEPYKPTVGSASLARVYENHGIRWIVCKRCGIKDNTQDPMSFESELVLGVDCCLMCTAVERQREEIVHHHSGNGDSTCTAEETLANHTTIKSSIETMTEDCYSSQVMAPIPESNSHTKFNAKLIIDDKDYFTSY